MSRDKLRGKANYNDDPDWDGGFVSVDGAHGGEEYLFHRRVGYKGTDLFIERQWNAADEIVRGWCVIDRECGDDYGPDNPPPAVAGPFDTLDGAKAAFLIIASVKT